MSGPDNAHAARVAALYLDLYGDDASRRASAVARRMDNAGDTTGADIWRDITQTIERMGPEDRHPN